MHDVVPIKEVVDRRVAVDEWCGVEGGDGVVEVETPAAVRLAARVGPVVVVRVGICVHVVAPRNRELGTRDTVGVVPSEWRCVGVCGVGDYRPVPVIGALQRHRIDVVGRAVVGAVRRENWTGEGLGDMDVLATRRPRRDIPLILTVNEIEALQDPAVGGVDGEVPPVPGCLDLQVVSEAGGVIVEHSINKRRRFCHPGVGGANGLVCDGQRGPGAEPSVARDFFRLNEARPAEDDFVPLDVDRRVGPLDVQPIRDLAQVHMSYVVVVGRI